MNIFMKIYDKLTKYMMKSRLKVKTKRNIFVKINTWINRYRYRIALALKKD